MADTMLIRDYSNVYNTLFFATPHGVLHICREQYRFLGEQWISQARKAALISSSSKNASWATRLC
jgi:hypothetical protein